MMPISEGCRYELLRLIGLHVLRRWGGTTPLVLTRQQQDVTLAAVREDMHGLAGLV